VLLCKYSFFMRCRVSEMLFFLSFGLQPMHADGSSGRDQVPSPIDVFDSGVASPPRSACRCEEYTLRILDL
jgi:hypothetical protein